jgi:DNA-directed RNA polymerase subunit E'/Rpb7
VLPEKYGNWHTVYYRISRRAKNVVIDKAFARLQEKQTVRLRIEVLSMDSTSVKVHPDAAGARKKTVLNRSEFRAEAETPKFIWLPRATE